MCLHANLLLQFACPLSERQPGNRGRHLDTYGPAPEVAGSTLPCPSSCSVFQLVSRGARHGVGPCTVRFNKRGSGTCLNHEVQVWNGKDPLYAVVSPSGTPSVFTHLTWTPNYVTLVPCFIIRNHLVDSIYDLSPPCPPEGEDCKRELSIGSEVPPQCPVPGVW